MKSIYGNYIGDSRIKKSTGFHAKDTGAGQNDMILREITGVFKEYKNDWYNQISVTGIQRTYCYNDCGIKLHHPKGFDFYIKISDFNNFIINEGIDIVNKVLQGKFKFVLNIETNEIKLVSDRSNIEIKTEDDFLKMKKSYTYIKTNQLKIGTVYQYYKNTNPFNKEYERIVFMGRMKDSKWLLKGSCEIDPEYIPNEDYLVFIKLVPNDDFYWATSKNTSNETISNEITNVFGPYHVILIKNISRKIRSVDENQRLIMFNAKLNKWENETTFSCLQNAIKAKINRFKNE